jgi:hypothetical protein
VRLLDPTFSSQCVAALQRCAMACRRSHDARTRVAARPSRTPLLLLLLLLLPLLLLLRPPLTRA